MFSLRSRRALRHASQQALDARRMGAGVYIEEWSFGPGRLLAAPPEDGLAEPVLAWCRETLGHTRRPWGIAHFDLALAVSHGAEVRSLSLRRLAPADLYPGDSLLSELTHFLEVERDAVAHLAVALFSWGDAAHATLPAS